MGLYTKLNKLDIICTVNISLIIYSMTIHYIIICNDNETETYA